MELVHGAHRGLPDRPQLSPPASSITSATTPFSHSSRASAPSLGHSCLCVSTSIFPSYPSFSCKSSFKTEHCCSLRHLPSLSCYLQREPRALSAWGPPGNRRHRHQSTSEEGSSRGTQLEAVGEVTQRHRDWYRNWGLVAQSGRAVTSPGQKGEGRDRVGQSGMIGDV